MDQPLAACAGLYRFHARMLDRLAAGMEEADWANRFGGNSGHWILAHLLATKRSQLRALCAGAAPEAWEALAGRGGARDAALPAASDLLPAWYRDNADLATRLEGLGADGADAPSPRTMPDGSTTQGGMARFLQFHEAYHLGQIGLLRRQCGKPGHM
jgi:uncharacterized damage-inducible protein DinB